MVILSDGFCQVPRKEALLRYYAGEKVLIGLPLKESAYWDLNQFIPDVFGDGTVPERSKDSFNLLSKHFKQRYCKGRAPVFLIKKEFETYLIVDAHGRQRYIQLLEPPALVRYEAYCCGTCISGCIKEDVLSQLYKQMSQVHGDESIFSSCTVYGYDENGTQFVISGNASGETSGEFMPTKEELQRESTKL